MIFFYFSSNVIRYQICVADKIDNKRYKFVSSYYRDTTPPVVVVEAAAAARTTTGTPAHDPPI